jgi:hypothetical protein
MPETHPMNRQDVLELENVNLKLMILRRNMKDLEDKFKSMALSVYEAEQLNSEEWMLDLDKGQFIKKV